MLLITQPDNNFKIKGSRDPLGFQPIWQKLGRKLINHLSTVSVNIRDFQVMSYAWYFWGDNPKDKIVPFFIRLEQVFAYARELHIKNDTYNGIDFVRKHITQETFSISNTSKDSILSNQRAYGIYGKYNRPFTEMKIKEDKDFQTVMEESLSKSSDLVKLKELIEKLKEDGPIEIHKTDLKLFAELLIDLSASEKAFYKRLIITSSEEDCQNDLFNVITENLSIINQKFELFKFIGSIKRISVSNQLNSVLSEIENTEKVLHIVSSIFRHMQSRPSVDYKTLKDEVAGWGISSLDFDFENEVVRNFNNAISEFDKEPGTLFDLVIKRNEEVCSGRNNAAWLKKEGVKIIRYYSEGGRSIESIDSELGYDNNYFIPSYISLYNQVMS